MMLVEWDGSILVCGVGFKKIKKRKTKKGPKVGLAHKNELILGWDFFSCEKKSQFFFQGLPLPLKKTKKGPHDRKKPGKNVADAQKKSAVGFDAKHTGAT